jgi:hypothetical protein
VSNAAFEAFSCYEFDGASRAFLVADVSVQCSSPWAGHTTQPRHQRIVALAVAMIMVYPVGLIVLTGALLFANRKAIQSCQSTEATVAIHFLWGEYEPSFFWWELVEMMRRLLLVGVFILVGGRGSITQLLVGTAFCMLYCTVQMNAWPFRDTRPLQRTEIPTPTAAARNITSIHLLFAPRSQSTILSPTHVRLH